MSTTLDLDEKLLADAERLASDTNRTVAQVVEDALRALLERQSAIVHRNPIKLHTVAGKLNPDVDFSSNVAIEDFLDQCDGFTRR